MHERSEDDPTIRAAYRKRIDREFVAPFDVPNEFMPMKFRQPWRMLRRVARLP